MKDAGQVLAGVGELAQGADDAIPRGDEFGDWPVGKPIPIAVNDRDLMAMLGIKHSRFYERKKLGHFAFLELRPQLPKGGTIYAGALVALWLAGDLRLRGR